LLSRANGLDGSYENLFNSQNRDFYATAGLADTPMKYRVGYVSHPGYGEADSDSSWKTYNASEGKSDIGHLETLIELDQDVSWLGNQYDNIMQTGGGDDYIDGGHGNDTISGGKGNDQLIGGTGNDTLEGGEGVDQLDGGADDDYLNGGAGNDFLNGGTGYDTYDLNNGNTSLPAAGIDIIEDADGLGEIVYGAEFLTGGKEVAPNTYKSDDGTITYSFILESGQTSGTLVITTPDGKAIINNFTEGDLGINFGSPVPVENIQIDNTLYGDGTPVDTNLSQPDIQYQRDDLGNLVLEDDGKETIDVIKAGPTNTEVFSGGLEDLIWGNEGNDILHGENGEDGINGWGGNDIIEGGDGADNLWGWTGNDRLFAGTEADLNTVFNSDDVEAGNDRDWLSGMEGDDLLIGSTGQNLLSGGEGNDVLAGGAGNDYLLGDSDYKLAGFTWILGDNGWEISRGDHQWTATTVNGITSIGPTTASSETFPADYGNDIIYGGGGNDRAWGGNGDDIIYGDGGDDNLIGEGGNDTLSGGDGNDILFGDASYIDTSEHGDDVLLGGKGEDQLIGGFGNDVLSGGADTDYLFGEDGEDILLGGTGSDHLYGGTGKDIIYGGKGADIIVGGTGNDVLEGGLGDDTYIYNLGDGVDVIKEIWEPPLDLSTPGYGMNTLRFGSGIGVGDLSLFMGSLGIKIGDTGDAIHIEGFDPDNPTDSVLISRFEFDDGSVLSYEQLLELGINFHGTEQDDTLVGTNSKDNMYGYAGNDTIIGRDGNDVIDGGTGNDDVFGDAGNDQINGGEGDDILNGGTGNDTLHGGLGDDIVNGDAGNDHLYNSEGVDQLQGGEGNDVYHITELDDVITENVNEGTDRIETALDNYTLGDNVEDLTLLDTAISGNGNELNNTLVGNAQNNIIDGGADMDTYVIDMAA